MLSKFLASFLLLVSFSSFSDTYPVDEAIADYRFKAAHLEKLRDFFVDNSCAVTFNGNKVFLSPGAIRSEGLVIGIAPAFPGDYVAFTKAPKPQHLDRVMYTTGAVVVGAHLLFDEQDVVSKLQFKVAIPYDVNSVDPAVSEKFYTYNKYVVRMNLADYSTEGKTGDFVTPGGDKVTTECFPK